MFFIRGSQQLGVKHGWHDFKLRCLIIGRRHTRLHTAGWRHQRFGHYGLPFLSVKLRVDECLELVYTDVSIGSVVALRHEPLENLREGLFPPLLMGDVDRLARLVVEAGERVGGLNEGILHAGEVALLMEPGGGRNGRLLLVQAHRLRNVCVLHFLCLPLFHFFE